MSPWGALYRTPGNAFVSLVQSPLPALASAKAATCTALYVPSEMLSTSFSFGNIRRKPSTNSLLRGVSMLMK